MANERAQEAEKRALAFEARALEAEAQLEAYKERGLVQTNKRPADSGSNQNKRTRF